MWSEENQNDWLENWTMTFDVALVINLDKRPDRWTFMQNTASKLGIKFERISAVDGTLVQLDSVSLDPLVRTTLTTGKRFSSVHLDSNGALGCFLSHRLAWKRIIDLGHPTLVLEDDANPTEHASSLLQLAHSDLVANRWDLVMFGLHSPPSSSSIVPLQSWLDTGAKHTGSWAYALTPAGAARLLRASESLALQVDLFLHTVGLRIGFVHAFSQSWFFKTPDIVHPRFEPVDKHQLLLAFAVGVLTAMCLGFIWQTMIRVQ